MLSFLYPLRFRKATNIMNKNNKIKELTLIWIYIFNGREALILTNNKKKKRK